MSKNNGNADVNFQLENGPDHAMVAGSLGYLYLLTYDPTVTATYGPTGVLAIVTLGGSPKLYQKQDDGFTTNWTLIASGGGNLFNLIPFGVSPNADGATYNAGTGDFELEPADATNPGGISTVAQDIPGDKTFIGNTIFNSLIRGDTEDDTTTTGVDAALSTPTKSIVRLTDAGLVSIKTMPGMADSQITILLNRTGNSVTVENNVAADGILTGTGADLTLADGAALILVYDPTSNITQVVGGSGGGSTPTGVPNNFAGYDPSGNLSSVQNWGYSVVNNALNVTVGQTYIAVPDGTPLDAKIINVTTEVNPDVSSTDQNVSNIVSDLHFDRTGSNNDFSGQLTSIQASISHEGVGAIGNMSAINANMTLGNGVGGNGVDAFLISASANVQAGYIGNNLFGSNLTIAGSGSAWNNINLYAGSVNQHATNISLLSLGNSGNASGNFSGININQNAIAGDTTLVNVSGGGFATNFQAFQANITTSISGGFSGLSINSQGTIAGNSKLLDLQSSGVISGNLVGSFFNIQSDAQSLNGIQLGVSGNITSSAVLGLFTYIGTANTLTGMQIDLDGVVSGSVTGLNIDVNGTTFSGTPAQKLAIGSNGGSHILQSPIDTSVFTPNPFFNNNIIGGTFTVAAGFPLDKAGFGNNLGLTLNFQDNYSDTTSGLALGYSLNGFANSTTVAAGVNAGPLNWMSAGGQLSGSGNITEATMFRAIGLIQTDAVTVDTIYGFRYQGTFGVTPTNEWAFYSANTNAKSYFAGGAKIGKVFAGETSTDASTTGVDAALPAPANMILRLTNVGLVSIKTITGSVGSQYSVLINKTGNPIVIENNDAADGILTETGANITLINNQSVILCYDPVSGRTEVIGGGATGFTVPLSIADGGTNNTAYTAGSIIYYDGTKLAEDNANFFWDEPTLRMFIGANASIAGSNAGIQYSNAAVANRAQIKLHSYFNGASIAGVSTLTSRSGTVGINNAVVAGQEYSKWTAQACATTVGSAPISGDWSFIANTVNSLTVSSDYRIRVTNLAGVLTERLYIDTNGATRLSGYGVGIAHFDASGNITSSAINLASADVTGVLPIAEGGTNSSAFTAGSIIFFDGTSLSENNPNLFWNATAKSLISGFISTAGVFTASGQGSHALGSVNGGANIRAISDGAVSQGFADIGSGLISSEAQGSFAVGYVSAGQIISSGNGAFAHGAANSVSSTINAVQAGSTAFGFVNNLGTINASGQGSTAAGYGIGGGLIEATNTGSVSLGYANINLSKVSSREKGSLAVGYADNASIIQSTQAGSFAIGSTNNASQISATGPGSFAQGLSDNGSQITASGQAAVAWGFAADGAGKDVIASSFGSFARGADMTVSSQFGTAFNVGHTVSSYAAFVIGRYASVTGTSGSWVATEAAFVIGNGTGRGGGEATAYQVDKDGKETTTAAKINKIRIDASNAVTISARTDNYVVCTTAVGGIASLPPGEEGLTFNILATDAVLGIAVTPDGTETIADFQPNLMVAGNAIKIVFSGGNWYLFSAA